VSGVRPRSGGRPTAAAAALLEPAILECATAAFLRDGYAATSIEAIAKAAGVAKRTIYARWDGKPALFLAVVRRLITDWLSTGGAWPEDGGLAQTLQAASRTILAIALTPEAIALHRLLVAEGGRFPELRAIVQQAGAGEGVRRLVALLARASADGEIRRLAIGPAAEQFMHLVLSGPQQRALGGGPPMSAEEIDTWCDAAVQLFLSGILATHTPAARAAPGKPGGQPCQ
jgi:AcrR family transcriptional regulator